MALSTVPGTVQAEVKFSLFGKFLENVLNFRTEALTITPAILEDLADALTGWYVASYMPLFSENLVLTDIQLTSLDFDFPVEFNRVVAQPGGDEGEALPVNVALATQFLTGLIGRSFKGRAYSSGVPTTKRVGNSFTPAHVTDVQLAWEDLAAALAPAVFGHVVVSRQQDLVTIDPAVATDVISYQSQVAVKDMGRRLDNS